MNHRFTYWVNIMKIKNLIPFVILSMVSMRVDAQSISIINNNSNDAFIEVSWSLPASCFEDTPGFTYPDGVYLQLLADGVEVYSEVIETTEPEVAENNYLHFVGPSKNVDYTLNLYERGPGTLIAACSGLMVSGQTTAYAPPTGFIASQDTLADRIELRWTNQSKLSTNFFIVRRAGGIDRVVDIVAGTDSVGLDFVYKDQFKFKDTSSIVNGVEYTYYLQTYSSLADSLFSDTTAYPGIVAIGNTFDIGLTATQFTFPNMVKLEWNAVDTFTDKILIQRDGGLLTTLEADDTAFVDRLPIYGFLSKYSVVLVKDDKRIVEDTASGGVNPIGAISGFVRTQDGYGINGVTIKYLTTIFDIEYEDSTVTDYRGFYSFDSLFYGTEARFRLTASGKMNIAYPNSPRFINISNQSPTVENFNFVADLVIEDLTDSLDIISFEGTPGVDTVAFDYSYFSEADTTYFQLYREGTLVDIADDVSGTAGVLSDRGGKPLENYKYTLLAYIIRGDSAKFVLAVDTVEYPDIEIPTNLAVTADFDDQTMGAITLTWDHISDNFAGFKIYRDSVVIAVIDSTARVYTDFEGEPGATYDYALTAFRMVNEDIFESDLVGIDNVMYPNFPTITSVTATAAGAENAVDLSWVVGAGIDDDNYTGFRIYRGTALIGEILKGYPFVYQDLHGEPGANYTYSVAPFVENIDSTFVGTAVNSNGVNFPALATPPALSVAGGSCRINISWSPDYNLLNYSNFDGFIIKVGTEVIDTLPPNVEEYTHYTISSAAQTVDLTAYRKVNGVVFESAASSGSGSATIPVSGVEQPSNVQFSQHIPMHVAITWEYPPFKFSKFLIHRDGVVVDSVPQDSRGYYDYNAEIGVEYEYGVQASYLDTMTNTILLSKIVYGKGIRKNRAVIYGQVLSEFGNGRSADSLEVRLMNGDTTVKRTFTDAAGFYVLEDLPPTRNQQLLNIELIQEGHSVLTIDSAQDIMPRPLINKMLAVNFRDTFKIDEFPPRPIQDSVARFMGAEATPLQDRQAVAVSWTLNDGIFDGVEVYRGLNLLGVVFRDSAQYLIDTEGSGGIAYDYILRAYYNDEFGVSQYSESTIERAVFPIFQPVENLTATPGYFGNDNAVGINWSHPTGEVDFYQIERNDQIIGLIEAGKALRFEDQTGIPDQNYVYSVKAVKQNGSQLIISEPATVMTRFPGVADPVDVQFIARADSNMVQILWDYNGDYVNNFRIYRDSSLIAIVDADSSYNYLDITGLPDTLHRYRVVSVLERDGMLYQSVGTVGNVTFPELHMIFNPSITKNDVKGLVDIQFEYDPPGVEYFEVEYMVMIPGGDSTVMFRIPFSELNEGLFSAVDAFGPPSRTIMYSIYAVSEREGIKYRSPGYIQTIDYPTPPDIQTFTASDGTFDNKVLLEWTIPLDANITGFQIFRNGVLIDSVGPGERDYSDIFNTLGDNASLTFNYQIRTYRRAYGETRFGTSISDSGFARINQARDSEYRTNTVTESLGFSVAIDGKFAVTGAPKSHSDAGRVAFYTYEAPAWERTATNAFTLPYPNNGEAGFDVDIAGEVAIIGHPAGGAESDAGAVTFAKNYNQLTGRSTQAYNLSDIAISLNNGTRYGEAVALAFASSDFFYGFSSGVGTYDFGTTSGINFAFDIQTNSPSSSLNFAFVDAEVIPSRVVSMDATDQTVVTGNQAEDIRIYIRSGNNDFGAVETINGPNGTGFGTDVSVSGNFIAVGAPTGGANGRVYIYKFDGSSWNNLEQIIEKPLLDYNSAVDRFGAAVGLHGDYLIVGAPDHIDEDGTTSDKEGLVFFYKLSGGTFDYVDFARVGDEGDAESEEEFGFAVDVGSEFFMAGAPGVNSDRGAVFFYGLDLIELWEQKLLSVNATDGTIANNCQITWDFIGNVDYIDGFRVYRDGIKIGEVAPGVETFNDPDGIPGKPYTYTVRVYVKERETFGKSDNGFRRGNGLIEGDVITAVGNAPVPGVTIEIEGIVKGEKYTYSGLTDGNGHFYFPNIYYEDTIAQYVVKATFEDHVFDKDTLVTNLSPQNSAQSNLFFIDRTAYVLTGTVAYEGVTSCGIDSVEVKAVSTFSDNTTQTVSAVTDTEGRYNLIVNPDLPDLTEIRLEIANQSFRSNPVEEKTDTIRHEFRPDAPLIFTSFANFERVNEINFDDTLTYETQLFVTTVCGAPASDGNFIIEVSTRDGCYSKQFQTTDAGVVNAALPPLNDLIIVARDVVQKKVNNLLIVDYLKYRPNMLNLRDVHIGNASNSLDDFELGQLIDQRLVYHKPANIKLETPFSKYLCSEGDQDVAIITRAEVDAEKTFALRFSVNEIFDGLACTVQEGYIVINNSAAKSNTKDTLNFNEDLLVFPAHIFQPGQPNLVAPFRKGINVKYYSAIGDLLGEIVIPVVIEGKADLPGADIVVDISDEDGQVKLPFLILRDPPGDGSSTSISSGTTITKSYAQTNKNRGGGGFVAEYQGAFFSIGAFADFSLLIGGGTETASEFNLAATTKQTISTSNTSDFVGERADVIVGVGSAIAYTINENLVYDEQNCELSKVQNFALGTYGIQTQWNYTVQQIRDIIGQLTQDTVAILGGSKFLYEGQTVLTTEDAVTKLRTRINNWKAVLDYHSETSVPFFAFCADEIDEQKEFEEKAVAGLLTLDVAPSGLFQVVPIDSEEDIFASAFESLQDTSDLERLVISLGSPAFFTERINSAVEARNSFCNNIGSNPGENFAISNTIQWDDQLVANYELAVSEVAYWLDSLQFDNDQTSAKVGQLDADKEGYLPQVENYTFSAGVDIEVEETINQTRQTSITTEFFVNIDLAFGLYINSTTEAGPLVISRGIENNEAKIGLQGQYEHEETSTRLFSEERESGVSYTLSDDDPGDQFSVTVFKPILEGHSPYFQLLGGRSSCPPEKGTIYRDRYEMAVFDTASQATFDFFSYENLDPEKPHTVYLQIANLSPFGEARDVYLYLDASSNENGAIVRVDGKPITGGNQSGGLTITYIGANQPFLLPIEVSRAADRYEFKNLRFIMRPSCTDLDLFVNIPDDGSLTADTVIVDVVFESPCTDITLSSPGDDWLITRRNPFIPDDREDLVVELVDYDPFNIPLEEIALQVRRIGDGSGWSSPNVPALEIAKDDPPIPGYDYPISKDSLQVYNAENFAVDQSPKLFFTWDITEDYADNEINYPDGVYEIRAVARCGSRGEVYSNVARGEIRRNSGGLFALLEPSDGIYVPGDEISVAINKPLNCSDVTPTTNVFEVFRKSDSLAVPGVVACFDNKDKLIFQPTDITQFDGDTLIARISAIQDENGIIYDTTFIIEFLVLTRDLFVDDNVLNVTMYQGSTVELSTRAFANSAGLVPFTVTSSEPWATPVPNGGLAIPNSQGEQINFVISSNTLPVGDTSVVMTFMSQTASPSTSTVTINVRVVAKPPYWVVNETYSGNMFVIANYRFLNEMMTSVDTMDQIAVFIDNEIRGVAKIGRTDQGQYAAFVSIGGEAEDEGKTLEFRVWDAEPGIEYNATILDDMEMPTTLTFKTGDKFGTFMDPEILEIDRSTDRARYIPLNGNGSWTWFSLNSEEQDMSVDNILRELTSAQDGDIIVTNQGALAAFVPGSSQWEGVSGLDEFVPENGYRIYLTGVDDTIRITGTNAKFGPIPLAAGFNLIGYPRQDTLGINTALAPTPNFVGVQDGDFIFTIAQDPSKPGLSNNMLAEFLGGTWNFVLGSGMEVMRPYFGYQVFVQGDATLSYPGATSAIETAASNDMPAIDFEKIRLDASQADPDVPETWAVDPAQYPMNMIMTGELEIDGILSVDTADMVAAFIDGECRGLSKIGYVKGQDKYYVVMFIYGDTFGEEVDIRFYDASENRILFNKERMKFVPSQTIGKFSDPYKFENKQFTVLPEVVQNACEEDEFGQLRIMNVEGMTQPLSYEWSTGDSISGLDQLKNGQYWVRITDAEGYWVLDSFQIFTESVAVPAPFVNLLDQEVVCIRDEVNLQAFAEGDIASELTYQWFNGRGKLLHEGDVFTIASAEKDEDIYVESRLRACPSERVHYNLEVNAPYAVYQISHPFETLSIGDTVRFNLSEVDETYTYEWDFGDGQYSLEAEPVHIYGKSGTYNVKLEVVDENGCDEVIPAAEPVIVQSVTNVEEAGLAFFRAVASPNPFLNVIRLEVNSASQGKFKLRLRDAYGRLIWRDKVNLNSGDNELTLDTDLTALPDGIYILEVEGKKKQRQLIKLLKAKP